MSTTVQEQTQGAEPYVSVPVVAELLGVPASWVYERTARGEIPYRRVGRYLRFRISEIEAWLEQQTREGVRG
jgi:excisionase family DNA binding protein